MQSAKDHPTYGIATRLVHGGLALAVVAQLSTSLWMDPDLADAIRRYLRDEGHAVDHVSTVAEAKAAMRVATYAAVLLDLGCPTDPVWNFCAANARAAIGPP